MAVARVTRHDGVVAKRAGSVPDWRKTWPGSVQATGPAFVDPPPEPRRGRALRRLRAQWGRGPAGSGPLRRVRENRLAGGIAAGLSARTGWDVALVRTVFVVAALLSGLGAVPYVLAWLLVPMEDEEGSIASRAVTDRRGITMAIGICSLLVVLLLLGSATDATSWLGSLSTPLVFSVAGLVLIWRNAAPDEQALMRHLVQPVLSKAEGGFRSRFIWRALIAAVLLFSGLIALLTLAHPDHELQPLLGITLVIAAIAVLLGPWWLDIARDLVVERQARARAEERADMAARVHDSVLQTLALIQRRADDPQQVVQLARAQERELRAWLFDGRPPGSIEAGLTLAAGVRLIQQEVEAQHGVSVEAVTVGDCELDDDLRALLGAAREATVNAVKWSGAPVISLFAEVEPAEVSLFVRDRGRGFDPETVPGDRKGLAESVHARMTRRGGVATVRSVLGEGTEVSLTMPRPAAERQASRA
jgi:signal transduction histidine kinase/phage shock protein PspC (stress-responsive transcriptional regulator)